ncbi:MAG: SAM-dependent methyltransferase [Nitrospirota bacterium]|nr:SAM-dependent methyltransferase [Nitrospirota bacterium]
MSKPELVHIIREKITQDGPIPFADFMAFALYHPKYGYYSSPGEKIGWEGDFYTSTTVHPIFGTLIARQIIQMAEAFADDPFTIVEVGAGVGTLCRDILVTIAKENPVCYEHCRYMIIEKSGFLKEKQKNRLNPLFPGHISWSNQIPKNLVGIVLSNELLDAFPVHRLTLGEGKIQEIYVDWEKDAFVEHLKEPCKPELRAYVEQVELPLDKTYQLEINLRSRDWITSVGEALSKGFVLTIDYGFPVEALYHPRKPNGTFLCYHKHKTNEEPYKHIGEQDMTAHIDFSAIIASGEKVGLKSCGLTNQMHFLMGLGITQAMEAFGQKMHTCKEAEKEFLAMKQLMNPNGMGKIFKVLIQSKKIPDEIKLNGLQFKAFGEI